MDWEFCEWGILDAGRCCMMVKWGAGFITKI